MTTPVLNRANRTTQYISWIIDELTASADRALYESSQAEANRQLKNNLNGFPDVNTYRDHDLGNE